MPLLDLVLGEVVSTEGDLAVDVAVLLEDREDGDLFNSDFPRKRILSFWQSKSFLVIQKI